MRVTGLSFSADGRLLSCSEDRCAYVWTHDAKSKTWISGIVELRASRAALCCSWSPAGNRFAVGLASKEVAICQYDASVPCWVAKKIGKHFDAAVTTLSWHPGDYLATGSTDRTWSVVDPDSGAQQIVEDTNSWVNAVAFTPSGSWLAIAPQDSSIRFKATGGNDPTQRVQWRQLPFLCLAFISDSSLVACGFDNVPVLVALNNTQWQIIGSLDGSPKAAPSDQGAFAGALDKFKGMSISKSESNARHKNTITGLSALSARRFATSSLDGTLLVWEISA